VLLGCGAGGGDVLRRQEDAGRISRTVRKRGPEDFVVPRACTRIRPSPGGNRAVALQDYTAFLKAWQVLQSYFLSVTCFSWILLNEPVFAEWQDEHSGTPLRVASGV
jgi:hypothetical protein